MKLQESGASVTVTIEANVNEIRSGMQLDSVLTEKVFLMVLPTILKALSFHIAALIQGGPVVAFTGLSMMNDKLGEANEEMLEILEELVAGKDPTVLLADFAAGMQVDPKDLSVWKDAIDSLDLSGLDPNE